jgi:hypothetical protein
MNIDKSRLDRSLRQIRALHRNHAAGKLSASDFIRRARGTLHVAYMEHTDALVQATASRFIAELRAFQTQFGLDLEYHTYPDQVSWGYRGRRYFIHLENKAQTYYRGSVQVFIGPFDEWDRVAIHTVAEREDMMPSLYTKRNARRWTRVEKFDFPDLLQWIKEETEKPKPEGDADDIPF